LGAKARQKRLNASRAKDAPSLSKQSDRPAASIAKTLLTGKALLISLSLILANALVFSSVLRNGFVNWDDPFYITSNVHVLKGLTWEGIGWAFTTGVAGNWHPLTWFSLMLDVEWFGQNAGAHHAVSLVLHTLSAILLFAFLRDTTGSIGRSAFVAALFALHPLHVESVAWAAERKDVLSTLLWMFTLWRYRQYVRNPRPIPYAIVVAFLGLGLMSKPMLVTLPFTLLLMDVWPLRRVQIDSSIQEQRAVWPQLIREKVPLFLLSAAASVITLIFQRRVGAVGGLDALPLAVRMENALVSYAVYVAKLFWPSGLAALYPLQRSIPGWQIGVSILVLSAISFCVIRVGRQYSYVPVGWLWYVGTLVPVIGFIQVGSQSMADRYTYVPAIGLFIVVAWAIPDMISSLKQRNLLCGIAAAVVLAGCAIVAHQQTTYWQSSITLWTHTVEVTKENYQAHNFLGEAYTGVGKRQEAAAHFVEALRINPDFPYAHNGLGNLLDTQGKSAEAMEHYSAAVRLKSDFPEAQNNLANALLNQGKTSEAIVHYTEAVRLSPDMPEPHNNFGNALSQQGKVDEAIHEYLESVRLRPDPDVYFNAGLAYMSKGNNSEAARQFQAALQLDPGHGPSRQQLEKLKGSGEISNK
jgi:Flp pilus assembly protein TadD